MSPSTPLVLARFRLSRRPASGRRTPARLIGTGLLLCLLALSAKSGETDAGLRQLLDSYAQNRQFNGIVLIARDGRILQRVAYGSADRGWDLPNTVDTRARVGSLTKPFTATLVMQLVQEGKLQLHGRLGDYLPDLYGGTPAAAITLAQLLNHSSGLRDLPAVYTDAWWQTQARHSYTPEAFARAWIPGELISEPGSAWRYSNAGYFVLGLIIEKITGASYADNLERRIFAPSGMTSSGLYRSDVTVPRLATGYETRPSGEHVPAMFIDPSVSYAAAGLYTTVDDLYGFDRALRGDRLLDAASRHSMWTNHRNGYGYGWGVEEWKLAGGEAATVMSHTGSIPGYQSFLLRSDRHQAFVAILDNDWQGELVVAMGKDLMEVLLGKPITLAKKSLGDLLLPIAIAQGNDAMVAAHDALGSRRLDYDTSERALNALGYRLLRMQRPAEAVSVLQWNVAQYPNSANAHDSLGEAYRAAGRITEALASYHRSLALDAGNENARKMIAEMQAPR